MPKAKDWHRQLLQQLVEPGENDLLALRKQPLLAKLDEYRRFRHRVRHIYSLELDDVRVLMMAQQVPETFNETKIAVEQFGEWLVQQAS